MISPVSFGSVYKIKTNNKSTIEQQISSPQVNEYCKKRKIPYFETSRYDVKYLVKNTEYDITTTVFSADNKDSEIETFLANKGIQYQKYKTSDILKPEAVKKRIKPSSEGYKTAVIDSEKLDKILINQEDNNFASTKSLYKTKYKKETQLMLKSMEKIPASTLKIMPWYNTNETIKSIKSNGFAEENSMVFNLEQKTDEPDNCMYFAMKGADIKDIPVYLDDTSYLIANALGIVKETL